MALKRSTDIKAEFSMSSLTDIIFLLLIFFMLTSSFVTINALNLHLPKADGDVKKDSNPIEVSVTKDLRYFVGTVEYEFAELPGIINDKLATELNEDGKRGTLIISVDENVPTGETAKILSIGKQLNAKVVLATEAK